MAQVKKQFQAPVVMGANFSESNGLPLDYESGGRRFESLRARQFLMKIQQMSGGTLRSFP